MILFFLDAQDIGLPSQMDNCSRWFEPEWLNAIQRCECKSHISWIQSRHWRIVTAIIAIGPIYSMIPQLPIQDQNCYIIASYHERTSITNQQAAARYLCCFSLTTNKSFYLPGFWVLICNLHLLSAMCICWSSTSVKLEKTRNSAPTI